MKTSLYKTQLKSLYPKDTLPQFDDAQKIVKKYKGDRAKIQILIDEVNRLLGELDA